MQPDISYIFRQRDGAEESVDINYNQEGELHIDPAFRPPEWTALSYQQCSHCPLHADKVPHCPVALNIAVVCDNLTLGESHAPVMLRVISRQREYRADTTVQRAMSSLIGLVCALGNCPYTLPLRAMGMTHLPLADERESLIRMASLHLLEQYIRHRDDPQIAVSLAELPNIYRNLGLLNRGMADRLRTLGGSDATLNAMVLLDVLSRDIRFELDSELPRLREFIGLTRAEHH